MKKQVLPYKKMTKQKSKLLCKRSGGELDDLMFGSMIEKMNKGGNAKRNVYSANDGEKMQEYKMGGWTHSAPSKKSKKTK
tara:strand:+ start:1629 stop:1868 length:240 start_codon:yes stop_codon:yes gene_type:complete